MDMSQHNQETPTLPIPGIPFIVGFGAFVVIGGLAIGAWGASGVWLPEQASVEARATDTLFYILLTLGAMVFFLVQGLLVYTMLRFRAKPNDTGDGVNFHGNATLEVVWTAIPAALVFFIAVISGIVWNNNRAEAASPNLVNGVSIRLDALAQRFAWRFDYFTGQQDVTGTDIILKSGTLHTYVGQQVEMEMYTPDVIHSFWVPAFRIKQDIMPGRTTKVRFTPADTGNGYPYALLVGELNITAEAAAESEIVQALKANNTLEVFVVAEEGDWTQVELANGKRGYVPTSATTSRMARYRLNCTELCGSGHGEMFTAVFVHPDETSFLVWYNSNVERLRVPSPDPVARGREILASGTYPCASCHVLTDLGWAGVTGPALNGIGGVAGERRSGFNGAEYLINSLHYPNEYIRAPYVAGQMPHFGYNPTDNPPAGAVPYQQMPEADLIAIVGYLCSQTGTTPADNDCGLEFNDSGELVDIEAANATLQAIADTYDQFYSQPE